jgi:hypothetical protein
LTNFKYRTAVAALALFATMACGGTANDMAAAQGVTVGVQPDHAEVPPRGTQGFAALVTGSAETAVSWSVQGGTGSGSISSAGLYTAPATTGTFTVVATSAADPSKTATATVTVTTSASGAVSIAVSPSSVSVPTGAVQSFVATVTNSTNTGATWSVQEGAAGGTITSSGVYTAPPTAGTYHVIATSVADATKKATATVTVTSSTPGAVTITVSPTSASVPTGAVQTFAATVSNSSNTSAN